MTDTGNPSSEWPDPDAPSSGTAPGSSGEVRSPKSGGGQFAEAYEAVGPDDAGVSSVPDDRSIPDGPEDEAPTVT